MFADERFNSRWRGIVRRHGIKCISVVEGADDVVAEALASLGLEADVAVSTGVGRHHVEEVDAIGLQDEGVAVEKTVGEVPVNLELLRIGFKTRVVDVQFATGNVFLLDGSANEEVRCDIISFRQFVSVTEFLDDLLLVNVAFVLGLLEDIQAVLNDVLGVGELLVDGFTDNFAVIKVILAVSYEEYLFLGYERVVLVDMVDALAVFRVLEMGDFRHIVTDEYVNHIFEHEVVTTGEQRLLVVATLLDGFCLLEEDVEQFPQRHQLVREVFLTDGFEQASSFAGLYHILHATWFDDVVVEVDVYREAVFLLEVFQSGVEEDDDVLVEIDRLVLVAELGIEGNVIPNHRLNLADGLAPVNFIVAAGIDNGNVREQVLMLLVKAEHRQHHVKERLVGVTLVGYDVLNLGVLYDAAVFVPGVIALN